MTRHWRTTHWRKAVPPIKTSLRTLYHRHGGRCAYCGRGTVLPPQSELRVPGLLYASRDHKTPRALGGGDERGNLTMACEPCNHRKQDMPWDDWHRFMAANPRWWEQPAPEAAG